MRLGGLRGWGKMGLGGDGAVGAGAVGAGSLLPGTHYRDGLALCLQRPPVQVRASVAALSSDALVLPQESRVGPDGAVTPHQPLALAACLQFPKLPGNQDVLWEDTHPNLSAGWAGSKGCALRPEALLGDPPPARAWGEDEGGSRSSLEPAVLTQGDSGPDRGRGRKTFSRAARSRGGSWESVWEGLEEASWKGKAFPPPPLSAPARFHTHSRRSLSFLTHQRSWPRAVLGRRWD